MFAVWDDLPAEKRELLLHYDAEVCPSCGNLRSECSDPAVDWHPRTSTCWATASREWGIRVLRERHKNAKDDKGSLHPLEGVSAWVSQVPPPEGQDEFAR